VAPDRAGISDNSILDAEALDNLAAQQLPYPAIASPHRAMRPAPSAI
jgi:hypothetical protein